MKQSPTMHGSNKMRYPADFAEQGLCRAQSAPPLFMKQSTARDRRPGMDKLVICMVGLPARGKSWAARRLEHFLSVECKGQARVFNVGNMRRAASTVDGRESADFFDATNRSAADKRERMARTVLENLLDWLASSSDARIGIFDATNTTEERRAYVLRRCAHAGVDVLFVENSVTDPKILRDNLVTKISTCPDYQGVDNKTASRDFQERIRRYEQVYCRIRDRNLSFIRVENLALVHSNNLISAIQLSVLECLTEAVDLLRLQRSVKGSRKTPIFCSPPGHLHSSSPSQTRAGIKFGLGKQASPRTRCPLGSMPTLCSPRRVWKALCRKREARRRG